MANLLPGLGTQRRLHNSPACEEFVTKEALSSE